MQEINVVVTMDVELPTSVTHASASGPPDYDTGDAWTRAFVELAAEYYCPSTLFIHPEVALARTGSFRDIAAKGNCLALHLHAWRFDPQFQCEFGGLTEKESRIMLGEASALRWRRSAKKSWNCRRFRGHSTDPAGGYSSRPTIGRDRCSAIAV